MIDERDEHFVNFFKSPLHSALFKSHMKINCYYISTHFFIHGIMYYRYVGK